MKTVLFERNRRGYRNNNKSLAKKLLNKGIHERSWLMNRRNVNSMKREWSIPGYGVKVLGINKRLFVNYNARSPIESLEEKIIMQKVCQKLNRLKLEYKK